MPSDFHGDTAAYFEHFSALVELEREEEMRAHREEMRILTGRERERNGRALLDLRGRDDGEALEGHLVRFMKRPGVELPETEIFVGDLVRLSRDDPLRDDNPTGTVTDTTEFSVTVAFDAPPPEFLTGRGLRMDLYVNDITYQRMLEALRHLREGEGRLAHLRRILVEEQPGAASAGTVGDWKDPDLNESQREAVRRALGAPDFFLIHGPPGTGKTTTVLEIVRQHVERGRTVLATAASNVAVDNLVEMLVDDGTDVVRVGHPARVTRALRAHTLDARLQDDEIWQEARRLRDRGFEIRDRQESLTHPSGRHRRGMSNARIRALADEGRGSRGVSPSVVREMARWLELQEEADRCFGRSRRLEDRAVDRVLAVAEVVCSTNSTAGSDLLGDRTFDVVVVDEATQATEPSCLIPITRGRRVVLAGDHRQLPPTVLSREAERRGLARSLFERLAGSAAEEVLKMLTVQYRMHRRIMDFPSRAFYDGGLEADVSVRDHTLRDLGFEVESVEGRLRPILVPEEPLVFVDTAGAGSGERQRADSSSRENPTEAEMVVELARALRRGGVPDAGIAAISPYQDQVDLIRKRMPDRAEDLEVRTVDGFQGREKEAVLLSLVRSNPDDELGFLEDLRRLNVAITRPRRKLIVVGDGATISAHPLYARFIEHVQEEASYVTT